MYLSQGDEKFPWDRRMGLKEQLVLINIRKRSFGITRRKRWLCTIENLSKSNYGNASLFCLLGLEVSIAPAQDAPEPYIGE